MKKYLCLFFVLTLAIHAAFPETVDEYLDIGEQYFIEGRFHEALSSVEEALRIDPVYALSHVALGVIYYSLNDATLALEALSHAIELDKTLAEAYFWRAIIYEERLNDYDKAFIEYDMAVHLDPGNDRYRRIRGNFLYTVASNFILALVDLNKAVEIDPLNDLNFRHRGVFHLKMGLYEMALDDFNAAIGLNRKSEINFTNKSTALYYLGRYEEAIENFNIALRLDSNSDEAYFNRGFAYYRLGMYREAALDFTEAIRLDPNNRDKYFSRAFLYRLLAEQADNPAEAEYYRDMAYLDEQMVNWLDGRRE